ncbi:MULTISPECIES: cysteine hydrolase family protein [Bradyrhizobium]|jgi:nicotinamidase-related amidase|uniref:cysteine hydrolase family protein n=1 Tax=Bradyrhizobium TaxID=374 RepID=UPI00040F6F35|nr:MULTISPECIES: isochorismatase family protein [Bradyrhizobium]MBO4226982.1 isochorismatase family protein [Bradyrhizobium neotropicale]RZN28948.1 cysteine hydrolase [Bradyrhizobium sp. Leo121]
MAPVIDLKPYVGASSSRLLVMVDLQEEAYFRGAAGCADDIERSLESCRAAIQHARNAGMPIAFTRRAEGLDLVDRKAQSPWIMGLEPKRADMVFERRQPSCYANPLFEDVVSRIGSFAIGGLAAEEVCLATAIDASHRGHRVTFLTDAAASRQRRDADPGSVHLVATKAIELFADVATTAHWLVATAQRPLRGHRYG